MIGSLGYMLISKKEIQAGQDLCSLKLDGRSIKSSLIYYAGLNAGSFRY